jgi:exodeoxyribonuclease-5
MSLTLAPQQDAAVRQFGGWVKPFLERQRAYFVPTGDGEDVQQWADPEDESAVYLQAGYAGTGKSTILPFMIEASGLNPADVLFVAPTGKAARVMTKKMKAQGLTQVATTIHRAIYRPKMLKADVLESQIAHLGERARIAQSDAEKRDIQKKMQQVQKDLDRAYTDDMPGFQLNVESAAIRGCRLVVVDEASMVGEEVAQDLASFGKPILAIGDPGQLQPVNDHPGFFFRKPDNLLSEIHRQALESPIIWASKIIREGGLVPYGVHGDGSLRVIEPKSDDVTFDMERDVQLLCGTNAKRWRTTRELRKRAGISHLGPVEGELMLCVKNSRQHTGLVNGTMLMMTTDTGILKSGDVTCHLGMKDEDGTPYALSCIQAVLEETYLGKGGATAPERAIFHAKKGQHIHQIDWGYVLTVHKSQGSQWDDVLVYDESSMFRDQSRQWLYTAVTRAAKTLTLVM